MVLFNSSLLLKVNHDHTWGVCRTNHVVRQSPMGKVRRALASQTPAVRFRRYSQCLVTCVHRQCPIASATPFNITDSSKRDTRRFTSLLSSKVTQHRNLRLLRIVCPTLLP